MSTDAGVKYADLPLISTLEKKEMKTAQELLEEMDAIQQLVADHTARADEIKLELETMQTAAKTSGFRWGQLCFTSRQSPGRETLDKVKLMTVAGVTAAQLSECTKTGKPYNVRTFRNLGRKEEATG